MRLCVSCKKRHPVTQLFRFNAEGSELYFLKAAPASGRSGWVCRSAACILHLLKSPGCSYRSLREKTRSGQTFIRQLKEHLFEQICSTFAQMHRSGRVLFGKFKIKKHIDETLFLMTATEKRRCRLNSYFSKTEVVLFKETPKLMSIALHKRSNGVISIQPHKEAVYFKQMLLLWSTLFCNDTSAENKTQPLSTEMQTQGIVL